MLGYAIPLRRSTQNVTGYNLAFDLPMLRLYHLAHYRQPKAVRNVSGYKLAGSYEVASIIFNKMNRLRRGPSSHWFRLIFRLMLLDACKRAKGLLDSGLRICTGFQCMERS